MLTALTLTLTLASIPSTAPDGIHLQATEERSARLIAQGPPPLPMRDNPVAPAGGRELELQGRIDSINSRLRELKNDWPTISVVMAWVGWSVSPIALVGLLVMLAGGAIGAPVVTLIGVVMLIVGLAAVAIGIAGVVTGITASNAAKSEREELIREREGLERELKTLRQSPGGAPGVDRAFESSPRLFTVAAF
ncbi:MAG: hypothetical protein JNJ54_29250 [Myxococcaceae bacterium]|nr:hypothetical protein [Myxococcaceae bacterium]